MIDHNCFLAHRSKFFPDCWDVTFFWRDDAPENVRRRTVTSSTYPIHNYESVLDVAEALLGYSPAIDHPWLEAVVAYLKTTAVSDRLAQLRELMDDIDREISDLRETYDQYFAEVADLALLYWSAQRISKSLFATRRSKRSWADMPEETMLTPAQQKAIINQAKANLGNLPYYNPVGFFEEVAHLSVQQQNAADGAYCDCDDTDISEFDGTCELCGMRKRPAADFEC